MTPVLATGSPKIPFTRQCFCPAVEQRGGSVLVEASEESGLGGVHVDEVGSQCEDYRCFEIAGMRTAGLGRDRILLSHCFESCEQLEKIGVRMNPCLADPRSDSLDQMREGSKLPPWLEMTRILSNP